MRFVIDRLDIRTRLALSFVLIMAAVLGAFSYSVYHLTLDSLRQQMEQDVRQHAALIAAAEPNFIQTAPSLINTDPFSGPDLFVQVLDPNGRVLDQSSNLGGHTLPFLPAAIKAGQINEVSVGGKPVFVGGRAVRTDGQLLGYVLVGESPSSIYVAIHRLGAILSVGVPIAVVLAGVVGWLLIWLSMRPLGRLSSAAARIAAARDHTQRLSYRGPYDEIGRLATSIDVMLQALEEAHRQVGALNSSQRRFLADISHQLRTPLTIMLSTLDLLNKTGADDPAFHARALAEMRVEAARMARMVTQLLTMARSEVGFALAKEPILIGDVVADVCRQVALKDSGVTLDWSSLNRLGDAVVSGDADYLKQLYLILLDNAVKYTPPGGRIDVVGSLDGNSVSITVADTGIGIRPEDLSRIFDRFFRAENARSQEGVGLGLAIARQIVTQHGGGIKVDSAPSHGSRFTVTQPLAMDAQELRMPVAARVR